LSCFKIRANNLMFKPVQTIKNRRNRKSIGEIENQSVKSQKIKLFEADVVFKSHKREICLIKFRFSSHISI